MHAQATRHASYVLYGASFFLNHSSSASRLPMSWYRFAIFCSFSTESFFRLSENPSLRICFACCFHALICVAWTSCWELISAVVRLPENASRTTAVCWSAVNVFFMGWEVSFLRGDLLYYTCQKIPVQYIRLGATST